MSNYLDFFPKTLLEDIIKGECLPIIGSGFSLNASMPDNIKMPLWDELGEKFAEYLPDYKYTNALDAISAFSHEYTRNKMIDKLFHFLNIDKIKPGDTHKSFAELPFKMVCTTNFDFLLEDAYREKSFKVIVNESQLSLSSDDNTTLILKIHGDLNNPNQLVATEEDYDLFIEKNPIFSTYLSYLLIVKTPLFLGYSIDDPDFRQIFKIVNERLGQSRRPAYTIKINAQNHEIMKYERRGVKVINIIDSTITNPNQLYSQILPQVFNELKTYCDKNVLKNGLFVQREPVKQIFNNKETQNRLCFFSVPYSELSLYKELVFPLVKLNGFIPISADEVITPGDTTIAKISALIDKSELAICDIADNNKFVLQELNMIIENKNKKILIIGNNKNLCADKYKTDNSTYIQKDDDLKFIEKINSWLEHISQSLYTNFKTEPLRLLKKEEYRSAIVSAFSLLEVELNKFYQRNNIANENKIVQYHYVTEKLLQLQILDQEQYNHLQKWRSIRNTLVHTDKTIDNKQAKVIVKGIMDIIESIQNKIDE